MCPLKEDKETLEQVGGLLRPLEVELNAIVGKTPKQYVVQTVNSQNFFMRNVILIFVTFILINLGK